MEEFTEEEARRYPPVLIHKAKLEATTQEALRRREPEREASKARGAMGGVAKGVGKAAESVGMGMVKGASLISRLKGIKTEDEFIKNKGLYGMGSSLNPQFTPLGRTYDRNNPMELYFGKGQRGAPPEAGVVLSAIEQGYTPDQLEVVTGLNPQQVWK
jgi:hypothetical protein